MKSMIFSCKFLRVCALLVPAEDDSSAGRALSPASVRSEPAWSTEMIMMMLRMRRRRRSRMMMMMRRRRRKKIIVM